MPGGNPYQATSILSGIDHADKPLDPETKYKLVLDEKEEDGRYKTARIPGEHLKYGYGGGKSITLSQLEVWAALLHRSLS